MRKNRSDAVHMMRTCEAYAHNKVKVKLVTPKIDRENNPKSIDDVFSLYNIQSNLFDLIELETNLYENDSGVTKYFTTVLQKLYFVCMYFWKNRRQFQSLDHIIISKCFISTIPIIGLKRLNIIKSPLVFELISVKKSYLHRIVLKNVDFLLCHSHFVRFYLIRSLGINLNQIIVPPRITQVEEYNNIVKSKKQEVRLKYHIDLDSKIVMYAGKVAIGSKELDYIHNVALELSDIQFYIVGASEKAMKHFENRFDNCNNIVILPFQTIPDYYHLVKAADILIGYYTKTTHHMYQLSPGKMGIYMASKNPVILSDLPSLRLRFQENMVNFVLPGRPDLLAIKITDIFNNYNEATHMSKATYEKIKNHTYRQYAAGILQDLINHLY